MLCGPVLLVLVDDLDLFDGYIFSLLFFFFSLSLFDTLLLIDFFSFLRKRKTNNKKKSSNYLQHVTKHFAVFIFYQI